VLAYSPTAGLALVAKETLFGSIEPQFYEFAFPLVPWFSLYFGSSAVGEELAVAHITGSLPRFARTLRKWAIALVLVSAVPTLLITILRLQSGAFNHLHPFLGIAQKVPPGITYLMFHGGLGLALLTVALWVERRGLFSVAFGKLARFGQTALFSFVVQYYVYRIGVRSLPHPAGWWLAELVGSIFMLIFVSALWHRAGGNRFISVGYLQLRRRWTAWRDMRPVRPELFTE
jgi:hypothetical protein